MHHSGVHDPAAIIEAVVLGEVLRQGVPVAGRDVRRNALSPQHVFQPQCRKAEFVEPRERGVKVCLVKDFAAVDHAAFERQKVDPSPLGV